MTADRQAHATDESDDSQLASRIARDDRLALCFLHEAYYPRLARLFSHLTTTRDPEPIQQLIEETMLNVWTQRESLDADTSVYVWIMRLAFDQARRPPGPKLPLHGYTASFRTARNPERDTASALDRGPERWVYALLQPLTLEERGVVHFVCTGHSCQQIADIMGVPYEQVKALLSRAALYIRGPAAATLRDRYHQGARTSTIESLP